MISDTMLRQVIDLNKIRYLPSAHEWSHGTVQVSIQIYFKKYMQMKFMQETDLEVQRSGERNSAANLLTRVFVKHSGIG